MASTSDIPDITGADGAQPKADRCGTGHRGCIEYRERAGAASRCRRALSKKINGEKMHGCMFV